MARLVEDGSGIVHMAPAFGADDYDQLSDLGGAALAASSSAWSIPYLAMSTSRF